MPAIQIKTALPGPKNQAILDRRDAAVSRSVARSTPVGIVAARERPRSPCSVRLRDDEVESVLPEQMRRVGRPDDAAIR